MSAPEQTPGEGAERRIVSVIVPCLNECGSIDAFCANVLRQSLPEDWRLQLLVADGMSDDGTRERLAALQAGDERVVWTDNPGRIVSTALNRAIPLAQGQVIVRMDVHTDYADDYVAQCLAVLQETGADNVGGPWCARADVQPGKPGATVQQAVAAAFQSRWVTGGALSRRLDYDGWVDTVYLGCWPRASFERFGGFDETLVRNQDDEHNLRIVRGGGRVWQSSRIRSFYRPRARLRQVFRQHLQYGYWKPFVMKTHGQAASWRHGVPAVFVAALFALGLAALGGGPAWPLLALLGAYAACVVAMTAGIAAERRPGWKVLALVPVVIAAYHVGYGVGSWIGARDVLRRARGRVRFASLTR